MPSAFTRLALTLVLSALCGWPLSSRANPSGAQVAAGSATLSGGAGALTITQATSRAIINWQDFSIGAGELTKFVQPDALSATLNRVVSGAPSKLLGSLEANGSVYLINPNGVLVGAGARIDAGGFLASTLDVSDTDFLKGADLFFRGESEAAVQNLGAINALGGDVFLIARKVENAGTISAAQGTAALAAGSEVLLTTGGKERVFVQASSAPGAIDNSGAVTAATAELKVAGGNAYALAINNTGLVRATGTEVRNGQLWLVAGADGSVVNTGSLAVAGGEISVSGKNILQAGHIDASGAQGGAVAIQATDRILQTAAAAVRADGSDGAGGMVTVDASPDGSAYLSGTLSAAGATGGEIRVQGGDVQLAAAQVGATGSTAGGRIFIGGGFQGASLGASPNARTVNVGLGSRLDASATGHGGGGTTVVWSEELTNFGGTALARGGAQGGDGGLIEVSSHGTVGFGGQVDAGAGAGRAGLFLLDPKNLTIDAAAPAGPQTFTLPDPNPAANDNHGSGPVFELAGGNIVVNSPNDDFGAANAGAVFLYDGTTRALISALTGSFANDTIGNAGVTALTNGNFVVLSTAWDNLGAINVGAATWASGTAGVSGAISAANSLIGSTAGDNVGINGVTELSSGNFLIRSGRWANGAAAEAGAVTWVNGAAGVTGALSAANSLVGVKALQNIGATGTVTLLTNGNYVVTSIGWDNGAATSAGAVTWGSGATGISGVISAANSLVGSSANDQVGGQGITALTNGNYVVSSSNWNNGGTADVGAVTWVDGTTGLVGAVSAANSLIGPTAGDFVGNFGAVALTNGNYVVRSSLWDNGAVDKAGAATWANGATGLVGTVTTANSLVGSTTLDGVSNSFVLALTNGNYVVGSQNWDNGAVVNAGAVTWGNGTTGTTGVVSDLNSLVGSTANDGVGVNGATALTNGNYIVRSQNWDNGAVSNAGAVTWGSGTAGVAGAVSAANSLVGSTAGDAVGAEAVIALSSGNYIVPTSSWDNGAVANAGAVTWGSGTAGVSGTISAANSLVGSTANDQVGVTGIVVLTNGNYVVRSANWDNGAVANAGAVTWGSGTAGVSGTISTANSLVGSTASDQVGGGGVTALSNGNYVVRSPTWDNGAVSDAGAATWGSGTTGVMGAVSAANSLVGSTTNDQVSGTGVTALTNGNYVVASSAWNNGAISAAGAVTWGSGTSGVTGPVTVANSLVGSTASDGVGSTGVTALSDGNYVVRSANWDGVAVNTGAVTWGKGTTGIVGAVSASNSLVGATADDAAGSAGVVGLSNGNFLVRSTNWDNGAVNTGMVHYIIPGDPAADPTGQTYSAIAGTDTMISPAQVTAILNNGTALVLQANNDLTVNDAVTANNTSGNGGALTLSAGRSVLLNAGITTDNGNLTLIANDLLANGVVDANRDAGAAVITMAGGATLNAGTGAVDIQLRPGTGLTNNTSGAISLRGITAGSLSVSNLGPTGANANIVLNGSYPIGGTSGTALSLVANNAITLTANSTVSTQGGGITFNSDRDATGAGSILLSTAASVASNGGAIVFGGGANPATVPAFGTTATNGRGIMLEGGIVSSGAGSITFTGTGANGAGGGGNIGIDVVSNGSVSSSTGTITFNGTAGAGAGATNLGISIFSNSQVKTTGGGNLSITGTGAGTGTFAAGVNVEASSAIKAENGGTLEVTGTGSASAAGALNHGIYLQNAGSITGAGASSVSLVGTAGAGSSGIATLASSAANVIGNSTPANLTGPLTLTANTMALANLSIGGSGALLIQPVAAGTTIGLGDSAGGTLNLATSELALLANGFSSITIGRSNSSGAIDVRTSAFTDPLTIRTPSGSGAISIAGNLMTGSGAGNTGSITLVAGGDISVGAAGSITTYGSAVSATAGDSFGMSAGGTITTNGGDFTGTMAFSDLTIAGSIATGAGDLTITSTTNPGTLSFSGASLATTSGDLTVSVGVGNASGTKLHLMAGTSVTTQTGAISFNNTDTNGWTLADNASISATGAGTIDFNETNITFVRGGTTVTGNGGQIAFNTDSLALGDVGNGTVTNTGGTVLLNLVTLGGGGHSMAEGANGNIIATSLRLAGTGTFNLAHTSNNVGTLAANITGPLTFTNGAGLAIGTVGPTTGVAVGANDVTIAANAGDLTVNGPVTTTSGSAGAITLRAAGSILVNAGKAITAQNRAITLNSDSDANSSGGIWVGSGASVASNGGAIVFGGGATPASTAAFGAAATSNRGIQIDGGSVSAGAGSITFTGAGGATGNIGIDLVSNSSVSTSSGALTFNGTGGTGSGTINIGISVFSNSDVLTTAGGSITLTGAGGGTGTFASGVNIEAGGTVEVQNGGNIAITGTGSAGAAGAANHGIFVQNSGSILAAGSGSVTLTGTAGAGSSGITAATGTNVIGNATPANFTGPLTLTADKMSLANHTIGGSGALLIQPATASASVGVGDTAAGTLALSTAAVAGLLDGFSSVTIGRADSSGAFDVRLAAFKDPLTIRSPVGAGTITVNGALSTGSGTSAAPVTLQAGSTLTFATGGSVTTQNQPVMLNSDRDASGAGAIAMNSGSSVATNGGSITLRGGSAAFGTLPDPTEVATQNDFIFNGGLQFTGARGDGSAAPGVLLNDADLDAGGGNIEIRGLGAPGFAGIAITGGSTVATTGGGTIALYGAGGDPGNGNAGVNVAGAGTTVSTVNGALTVYGLGRGVGTGHGLLLASSAEMKSVDGDVDLRGASLGTGAANHGVALETGSIVRTTGEGDVTVVGRAAGTYGIGVFLSGGSLVQNTDEGDVSLTGFGTSTGTSNNNEGVKLVASTVEILSGHDAQLTLNGTGGTGANWNIGVNLTGGSVARLGANVDDGRLNVQGVGGTGVDGNWGILVEGNSQYESLGWGAINFFGTAGTGGPGSENSGIKATAGATNAIGSASMLGDIQLRSDTIDIVNNVTIRSAGKITIEPKSQGTTIGLGDGAAGTLHLNAAELAHLHDGFERITIGRLDGTGAIDVRAVTFTDDVKIMNTGGPGNGGIAIGGALNTGSNLLWLASAGTVTQTAPLTAGSLLLTGSGSFTLTHTGNSAGTLAAYLNGNLAYTNAGSLAIGTVDQTDGITTFAGTVSVNTVGATADLTLAEGVAATGTGTTLQLGAGRNFINNAGSSALDAGAGRWLVWSSNPSNDSPGGLANVFKQYNATFGVTTPGQAAGNGFLYTLAPTITPSLTGSVSRAYNQGTAAALSAANFTFSGAVNGDTVTLTTPTAGTFDTKDAGTGKTVSAGGISIASQSNGAISVYGYQLVTSASGAIGTITPLPLSATVSANNKVYNATTAATGSVGPVTGVIAGDTVNVTGTAALSFDNKNVGTGKTVTVSGLTLGGTDAGNYTLSGLTTTADITAATLTYAANAANRLYGAGNPAFSGTVTGFEGGDTQANAMTGALAFTSAATTNSNAGSHAISGSGLTANDSNYVFVQAAGNATALTINPAPLTITADSFSRAFGAANPALTATYTGLVAGDTSAVVTGLNLATAATSASAVGSYPITATGAVAANYTITLVNGTLAIGQNLLTISAENKSKVYGAALPGFTATYAGLVNGDTSSVVTGLVFDTTASIGSNVGTYTITPSGATAPNYSIAYVPGTLTITSAPLTITANNAARGFGAPDPVFSATYSGFVNGDTSAVLTGLTFGTTATANSPAGTYAITPSGASASNYAITYAGGLLSITQNLLTITAENKSKIYGSALPEFTATYTGLLAGDTPSVVTGLQFSTTATAGSNTGTYTITPFGASAGNYTLAYVPGTLTISPAALTITANNSSRIYGAANPAFSASFSGFVNGDTSAVLAGLSFATPATATSSVGGYAITPSGGTAANYTITYVPGTLTVSPAPLTITAGNASRTYGSANPAFNATFAGFVNGETSSLVTGLTLGTTATASSGVGNYAISASGATAPNYAITYVPGTLAVTPAPLTITANNVSREFGQSNPAFTASFAGLVNGEAPSVASGLILSTPATAGSVAGTYPITPLGATAANYAITFVNGALTVTAPAVVVDNTPATVPTINDQPVLTTDLAVVVVGDRFVLVPITPNAGAGSGGSTTGVAAANSIDSALSVTLGEATNLSQFDTIGGTTGGSTSSLAVGNAIGGGLNLSGFQIVAVLGGGSSPGGGGGANATVIASSQPSDAGLLRESTVNMGGFNVVYREAVNEARDLATGNTALGSSYHEFLDTEAPQVILLRAAPGTSSPGGQQQAPGAPANSGGGGL